MEIRSIHLMQYPCFLEVVCLPWLAIAGEGNPTPEPPPPVDVHSPDVRDSVTYDPGDRRMTVVKHPDEIHVDGGYHVMSSSTAWTFPLYDAVATCNGYNIADVEWEQIGGDTVGMPNTVRLERLRVEDGSGQNARATWRGHSARSLLSAKPSAK